MTSRPVTTEEAEWIVDAWEAEEGESMREGHRATLERLIAAALSSAQERIEEAQNTTDQALQTCQVWVDRALNTESELATLRERIAELEKREGEAREALKEHGDHSGACALHDYYPNTGREAKCTCGFWEACGLDAFGRALSHPPTGEQEGASQKGEEK